MIEKLFKLYKKIQIITAKNQVMTIDSVMISLDYKLNTNLSLLDNVKNLLAKLSLDAIEFEVKEKIESASTRQYEAVGVSILGKPNYIDQQLKSIVESFADYLKEFINDTDFSNAQKKYFLDEATIFIQQFLLDHHPETYFLNTPSTFRIYNLSSQQDEVVLSRITLNDNIYYEIKEHLTVRRNHLSWLNDNISLCRKKIRLKEQELLIKAVDVSDSEKVNELLELWIAIESYGLLNHIAPKDRCFTIPKLRERFFEIFGEKLTDYASQKKKLVDRKTSEPVLLPKLLEIYSGITKRGGMKKKK